MHTCRKCGTQWNEGSTCPQCGLNAGEAFAADYTQYTQQQAPRPAETQTASSPAPIWLVLLIVGGMLLVMLAALIVYLVSSQDVFRLNEEPPYPQATEYIPQEDAEANSYDTAQDLEDKMAYQREKGIFTQGFYEVGKDVPPGEYVVLCGNGPAAPDFHVGVYTSASQSEESTLFSGWYETSKYVILEEGQYIDLSHASLYDTAKNEIPLDPFSSGGMYKVGADLDAGSYTVVNNSDQYTANYAIYSSINAIAPVSRTSGIVDVGETAEITLQEGEYIEMKFCCLE